MQNIIHLLALIRIAGTSRVTDGAAVVGAYAQWIRTHGGFVIDSEPPQVMVCIPDPALALASLHALMHEGSRAGFTVAGGIVQAIRATEHVPSSPNDFTERTLQTVIELSGSVGPQQLAITGKLLSLLQLAVPGYARHFVPAADVVERPVTRVRQMLVLDGDRLPPYAGPLSIVRGAGSTTTGAPPSSRRPG